MDFDYFRALIKFNAACASQAHETGFCIGHGEEYWEGAYTTSVLVAMDSHPEETRSYFKALIEAFREEGSDEEAEALQKWLNEHTERRH